MSFWAGRRVLLTGHTGFKGSWMALWLLKLGVRLTGYALKPTTQPALFEQIGLAGEFDGRVGDIRDSEALAALVREVRPEVVFHFAAQPIVLAAYDNPIETFAVNLMGTANLLDALRRLEQPCTAVMVTTDKVYENTGWRQRCQEGDPLGGRDPYSASKAAAEIVISSYRRSFLSASGVRIASARAGNVIGGGDWSANRVVPDLVRAIVAGDVLYIRNPGAVRPWQHVVEPLGGYLALAEQLATTTDPALADAFNFGPAAEADRSVRELVEEAISVWPGDKPSWRQEQFPVGRYEADFLSLSVDRAGALLGWRPRWTFSRAVRETMAWYHASLRASAQELRALTLDTIARYEMAN